MAIVSGITDRGTVWIKKLDRRGNLLQKRVFRNRIQYDTLFSKQDGRPKLFLRTNFYGNTQTAYKFPKRGFWNKFLPEKRLKLLNMNNSLLAKRVRRATGFDNKNFDRISENLLARYLENWENMYL